MKNIVLVPLSHNFCFGLILPLFKLEWKDENPTGALLYRFDDFLEFSFKCYSFILFAVGLGVKLISFSQKKKKAVCEENENFKFFFKICIFLGKIIVTWRTRYYVTTRKKNYFYFLKQSIFRKKQIWKTLTWHHVTSWCEYTCRDVKKKIEKKYLKESFLEIFLINVTSCDVIHVGTWEQKNFECYQRWHYPSDAMSMPWNVIKVTVHSSSHYPSDAMSMQCPCKGMLSTSHYILAHITQAMQCPCNVYAMECCQGDITHGMQCPCYGMWARWATFQVTLPTWCNVILSADDSYGTHP